MRKGFFKASEFGVKYWIDEKGSPITPIQLKDINKKFKVIFCFQNWCPGCHSDGFPTLVKMVNELKDNSNVFFMAIQTVFEGFEQNSISKISELQKKYNLEIPFGHDAGIDDHSMSIFMQNYQTGGTPWFVLIDNNDIVISSGFNINANAAIHFLKMIE